MPLDLVRQGRKSVVVNAYDKWAEETGSGGVGTSDRTSLEQDFLFLLLGNVAGGESSTGSVRLQSKSLFGSGYNTAG